MKACVCANGTYALNYICTPCGIGYYCSGGTRTVCPAGKTTTLTTVSTSVDQCVQA